MEEQAQNDVTTETCFKVCRLEPASTCIGTVVGWHIASAIAQGEWQVTYGPWWQGARKGTLLTAFSSREAADKFMQARDDGNFYILFEALGRGKGELPAVGAAEVEHYSDAWNWKGQWLLYQLWPLTTVGYREIKLVKPLAGRLAEGREATAFDIPCSTETRTDDLKSAPMTTEQDIAGLRRDVDAIKKDRVELGVAVVGLAGQQADLRRDLEALRTDMQKQFRAFLERPDHHEVIYQRLAERKQEVADLKAALLDWAAAQVEITDSYGKGKRAPLAYCQNDERLLRRLRGEKDQAA
jgi:hypothetical protein